MVEKNDPQLIKCWIDDCTYTFFVGDTVGARKSAVDHFVIARIWIGWRNFRDSVSVLTRRGYPYFLHVHEVLFYVEVRFGQLRRKI